MTGFLEDAMLRLEGLTDADIATVNKRLPDLTYYLQLVEKEAHRLSGLIADLEPIIEKIIKKQENLT